MLVQFNANEVFEIGIEIEKNGKVFYQEAAKIATDEAIRKLFSELSEWEDSHVELFKKMRSELPDRIKEDTLLDPDSEYRDYLQAAADSHVFARSTDISKLVAQCTSSLEALDLAMRFEKDSVVFYTTIKNAASAKFGGENIDTLIDEELKHIALLSKSQQELEKGVYCE